MTTEKRFKRGDLHPDGSGRLFWVYSGKREVWMAEDRFMKEKERAKIAVKKYMSTEAGREKCYARCREYYYKTTTPEKRKQEYAKFKASGKKKPYNEARKEYMKKYGREYKKKECVIERVKKYKQSSTGRAVTAARAAKRYSEDMAYMVMARVMQRTTVEFKRRGFVRTETVRKMTGCKWGDLVSIMESRFLPGMSWENRGEWHIDHRIPLSSAESKDALVKLCHFDNLWPLWASDNQSKHAKMPDTLTESFLHRILPPRSES